VGTRAITFRSAPTLCRQVRFQAVPFEGKPKEAGVGGAVDLSSVGAGI
jgi:hypothetical protein